MLLSNGNQLFWIKDVANWYIQINFSIPLPFIGRKVDDCCSQLLKSSAKHLINSLEL